MSNTEAEAMTESFDLTGKLLIAMPGMPDPRFARSVVLVCAYSDRGAMGITVNKPSDLVTLRGLLEQLATSDDTGFTSGNAVPDLPVHSGGPVEMERGFVVHSADYESSLSTLAITDDLGMTATLDVLEEIATGEGPRDRLIALGYCGWGPGQIEAEISASDWLIGEARRDLIFGSDDARKWERAIAAQGIDPLMLSPAGGSA